MFNIEQLFQMLNQPGTTTNRQKQTRIIISHDFLVTEQQFKSYSNQIKAIYEQVFVLPNDTEENTSKEINLEAKLLFQRKQTPMPICNKILTPHQAVFRCYDCMTHQASVLCKKCFQNANHKGHRYSQISSGGGNCDCGNPDAIKPVGFCVDHPGKAEPVILDQKQEQHFMEVVGVITQWIFRLHERQRSKSGDILGQQLADFLLKMNDRSLYYNTLTYGFLFSKRIYGQDEGKREQKIIDKIFEYGVKLVNFARKITDVFLNMFSLQIFKYKISISFTQAYNTIKGFQTSKFKSLYIQLFANNDILERILNEEKLVLYPTKDTYDFGQYIENLVFLSSIKEQVASKFFVLLNEKGYVRFPQLDTIEQKVEKNGEHIVNTINQILNFQNYYYMLMETIVGLVQNHPQSLVVMLRNYVDAVMDKQYSYEKNKVVMPFHKILGMILLGIYRGNLQKISAKEIQKFIGLKYTAKEVFCKIFKLIMQCFRQFSKTFFQTSYFDNYIPLYVKSGHTTVVFDLLMFTISIKIFQQILCQNQMNQILFNVFQIRSENLEQVEEKILQKKPSKPEKISKFSNNESQEMEQDWEDDEDSRMDVEILENNEPQKQDQIKTLKKNIQLMKLMIEGCISERSQILVANSIKIKDENMKLRTEQSFVEVMNNFKQISAENLKSLNKNFIETKNLEEDLIKNFLTFDKIKKKYTLNEMKDEKFSNKKTPLYLYSTMKKFGGIFAQQVKEPLENLLININLPKQKLQRLKFLFNDQFIDKVSKQFLNQLTNINNLQNKQVTKAFLDFLDVIKTLQYLMRQSAPPSIFGLYDKIADLSEKEEFSFLSEKLIRKQSQDLLKKEKLNTKLKFQEMKKKKLQKIKKMQQSYSQILQAKTQQKQENQSICMICRDENNEGLCFLSNFSYSNTLQAFNKVQGRSLVFDSCFHPIHIKCFIKTSKEQSLPCPLCRCLSNIMLPFQKQFYDEKTILDVYERIITLKVTFDDNYEGFDKDFEEFGILSVFRALSSMISKNLLKNQPILDHKDQRLANILYGIAKTVALEGLDKDRQKIEAKALDDFLQILLQNIKNNKSQTTNFYAVQYVTLKILHYCFVQNSNACTSVLNKYPITLINKNDLRKIWQMCDQIVSLPLFIQPKQSASVKQMSTVVDLYVPPETVFQLIKVRDSTQMSCKNGHQMCICLICKVKCCYDCKEIKKHFSQVHSAEGLAFNILTGGLVYVWDGKLVQIPSLYCNQMGFEWKPSKSPEGFFLDKQTFGELKKAILNETIAKFLVQRYPDVLKKGFLMGMNFQ